MKIAIIAGGTGGHIYPGIALADELVKRGHDITFIGSTDRMEKDVIPEHGYKYIGLNVLTTSGNILQKIKSLVSMVKAYFSCLDTLKSFDMAIGFGNYISIPVMLAACKLKLKTAIHEQNSFVGKANLLLDNKVDLVIGTYEENKKQFKNPKTYIIGNPQSSKAMGIKKDKKVLLNLGLNPDKKTVVIFMGSLGSSSVNDKLIDYFKLLNDDYQVVYATGYSHFKNVKAQINETANLKIFERIDGIRVMKNSDLLVCRAGATTLSEICALGMPAILIPSPFVANNHQYYNAKALADKNAALMIEEKELAGRKLFEMINETINDKNKLKELGKNARLLANDNVIDDMIGKLESL